MVRLLDRVLADYVIPVSEPIAALADTRLGIDGGYWLRSLMLSLREPLAAPLGAGFPAALHRAVMRDVDQWRHHRITPLVVFSGLPIKPGKADQLFPGDAKRSGKRTVAWDLYHQATAATGATSNAPGMPNAIMHWSDSVPIVTAEMHPTVMAMLAAAGVETLRAPYSAWGQLAYLMSHSDQPIHAVYAPPDALMFDGIDRLITHLDLARSPTPTFTWVDKDRFLAAVRLSPAQFLDACILAGCDWLSTYYPFTQDKELEFNWGALISLVQGFGSGISLIHRLGEPSEQKARYIDDYARVRCFIKHQLVLTLPYGAVAPLNRGTAPSDLHEVFGHRFPDSVYALLAKGALHPTHLLAPLLHGVAPEFAPPCGGETAEYRAALDRTARARAVACAVAAAGWDQEMWRKRTLAVVPWYLPRPSVRTAATAVPVTSGPSGTATSPTTANSSAGSDVLDWITAGAISLGDPEAIATSVGAKPRDPKRPSDAATRRWGRVAAAVAARVVVHGAVDPIAVIREVAQGWQPEADSKTPESAAQLATTVVLDALTHLGYLSATTHAPTPLGHALAAAAATAASVPGERQLLQAELIRDGALHGRDYSRVYESGTAINRDLAAVPPAAREHIVLLSRVAATVDLTGPLAAAPWSGPLSRDLLTGVSVVKAGVRAISAVTEGWFVHHATALSAGAGAADEYHAAESAATRAATLLPLASAASSVSAAMPILTHMYLTRRAAAAHPPVDEDRAAAVVAVSGRLGPASTPAVVATQVDAARAAAVSALAIARALAGRGGNGGSDSPLSLDPAAASAAAAAAAALGRAVDWMRGLDGGAPASPVAVTLPASKVVAAAAPVPAASGGGSGGSAPPAVAQTTPAPAPAPAPTRGGGGGGGGKRKGGGGGNGRR
ncbi:hypothetical protein BC828DRAFT_417183 [Blastocladiella britannica]|nr:hypothetical protein BC828DRAFT_417183 [Blastocladiella britannica]